MSERPAAKDLAATVAEVCQACGNDPHRLMDIVKGVQKHAGHVSSDAMVLIADELQIPRVEVESVVSFYSFYSEAPQGRIVIRLCNDVIDRLAGADGVAQVFCDELGIAIGETTPDGAIHLTTTPCIGMCDQAPAALINDVVVTSLNTDRARDIVRGLKDHKDPRRLIWTLGDGNNADDRVQAMVQNNIRQRGPVILSDYDEGQGLEKALALSPNEVIRAVNNARLRGRGGAGFPAGMKWQFTRDADGERKFIICNADEGEPGTFKDRVVLTERADLMFEGMTIAGYAIGAAEGIVYLRGEYAYLTSYLTSLIDARREQGLLGQDIQGKKGFNFDIRIQMGAGAYICGEETALISSCEGQRGDPKTRPPFPAQEGYLKCPTVVNNVETFCAVSRILDKGAGWFARMGSGGSSGTKLLSISGDCRSPGVYEVEFGTKLSDVLKMVGAERVQAVQMGGPSGQLVGPADFERTICYDDLATGGAMMVFNEDRDLLQIVDEFMEFFIDESCGYCTPCRVGNVLLRQALGEVIAGRAMAADLDRLAELASSVKTASRCGLGQTSPNPILSSLEHFRPVYEAHLRSEDDGMVPSFDLTDAVGEAAAIAGRPSAHTQA